jgi:hypothetical protein
MASFATSWKRSKHNDEKNLSEFLLNQEIPRLEGIACALFDVKFDAFRLTLRSVERALREAAIRTGADASQAQQVSHVMRSSYFASIMRLCSRIQEVTIKKTREEEEEVMPSCQIPLMYPHFLTQIAFQERRREEDRKRREEKEARRLAAEAKAKEVACC